MQIERQVFFTQEDVAPLRSVLHSLGDLEEAFDTLNRVPANSILPGWRLSLLRANLGECRAMIPFLSWEGDYVESCAVGRRWAEEQLGEPVEAMLIHSRKRDTNLFGGAEPLPTTITLAFMCNVLNMRKGGDTEH